MSLSLGSKDNQNEKACCLQIQGLNGQGHYGRQELASRLNFKRLSSALGPKNLGLLYFSAKLGQHTKKTIP